MASTLKPGPPESDTLLDSARTSAGKPAKPAARHETQRPGLFSHRQLAKPAPAPQALALLADAKRELGEAVREQDRAQRFAGAYQAALRASAAVLAARGRPHRGRARPVSAWKLLSTIAPELAEWAGYFEANSATRAAVQAGITRDVGIQSADELVRQSTRFLAIARRAVHAGG
ncbi:hypothetical protein EV191_102362 [Tamaricihabitans halophyticus]|uniref:SAV-6107-like HEPN domain-containing protein n=1 Tax=Tamaricihabitans halophyticus TaxID=1262583 RepID=A0A4R2QY70_9PSEU|nr:SAV_6107 family HEPN domain-containing protein [Tamaricihabitans halophyticus]TCP55150.1 hypothetical protein EV191_102362 [Tamaricihabitans halophyticus]